MAQHRQRTLAAFCIFILPWAAAKTAPAAIINDFMPERHNRFQSDGTVTPGFLLPESQLSGIALGRGVLISPLHYVAAAHVSTPSVTFRGSDGVERTYSSVRSQTLQTTVPGEGNVASDIIVHTLSQPVDSTITPLPIIVGSANDLVGQVIYAFDQSGRAGRNVIESVDQVEFSSGAGDSYTVRFSYDTSTNGGSGSLGADEIGLLGGDSGYQAVLRVGDQIGAVGTHMGIDFAPDSDPAAGDRYDSFSTFLSVYESQLESIVVADGYQLNRLAVTAIPEPVGTLVLALLGATATLRRRPRRDTVIGSR